jgi:transposase
VAQPGRPTKYTPETVERICEAIRLGATYALAAGYGGISYETFRVWNEEHPAFSAAVKDAEAAGALKWLTKIEAASEEQWQAAARKLERRYPQDYGRTVVDQKHSGSVEHTVTIADIRKAIGVEP